MSFVEKLRGKFHKDKEPFEPNEIQAEILNIGSQWKMDGTPWWSGSAMSRELSTRKKIPGPGTFYKNLHELRREGACYLAVGKWDAYYKPVREVPLYEGEGMVAFYYQISAEGSKMRGKIYSNNTEISNTTQFVPEV